MLGGSTAFSALHQRASTHPRHACQTGDSPTTGTPERHLPCMADGQWHDLTTRLNIVLRRRRPKNLQTGHARAAVRAVHILSIAQGCIHHGPLMCMDRSYQAENARSRPLPEAKLPWASPVVGWVTTCEPDVTICAFAPFLLWVACLKTPALFAASHPEGRIRPWVPGSNPHVGIFCAVSSRAARRLLHARRIPGKDAL